MKIANLYPDDIPTNVFEQMKYLVVEKGMTLKDAFYEIESKLHAQIPSHIKDRILEESYRW